MPRTAENSSGPPTSSSCISGAPIRAVSTPRVRFQMPPRSIPSSARRAGKDYYQGFRFEVGN